MIGLTADKLLLIAVLVGFLFGPERLPGIASRLGSSVRAFRGYLATTEQRMREELGDGIDVQEWKKLDPRQYDPRTIIRNALAPDPSGGDTSVQTHRNDTSHPEDIVDTRSPEEDGAAAASDAHSTAQPVVRPVFRRRSDGHLEHVPYESTTSPAPLAVPVPSTTPAA